MLGIDVHVLIRTPKMQILAATLQKCETSDIKHSVEIIMLLNFLHLSTVSRPKLKATKKGFGKLNIYIRK